MKKLLLLVAIIFMCLQVEAQRITPKFLEGTWETEFHLVEFEGNDKQNFNVIIKLVETGENVEVINWRFENKKLYMKTYYQPNDWTSFGKMVIVDENTMVEDVDSDYPGLLIYKRKLKY